MLKYDINSIEPGDVLYVDESEDIYGGTAVVEEVKVNDESEGYLWSWVRFEGLGNIKYDLDELLFEQQELQRSFQGRGEAELKNDESEF